MVTVSNSTSVTLTWNTPAMPNGIIQHYIITLLDDNMNSVQNQTLSNLMTVITQLTPNTSYVVNVSAVTVRSGDAASMIFTTPACKHNTKGSDSINKISNLMVIYDLNFYLLCKIYFGNLNPLSNQCRQ